MAYFTRGSCAGGCVGAMAYYTASGEPPGQWAGKGARSLGLDVRVDPDVIERLYQKGIGPGGEMLLHPRVPKPVREREDAAVAAFMTEHPFASAVELAEIRAAERAKEAAGRVPYYDLTNLDRQVRQRTARLAEAGRQAGQGRRGPGRRRRTRRRGGRHRNRPDRVGPPRGRAARGGGVLHPDRAPLVHHRGVAGRDRVDRGPVHAPHQP